MVLAYDHLFHFNSPVIVIEVLLTAMKVVAMNEFNLKVAVMYMVVTKHNVISKIYKLLEA